MMSLVGVMVAVAMLLVMVAEVVSGSRRSRESEGRDKKGGGEQGSQHGRFLFCPNRVFGRPHYRPARVNAGMSRRMLKL
jgi:hypothetical protein